ncbi:MBL fold metallo-hydrolase [Pseudonocardiaceae bacterium YIM PH 21723]|nr:MBL fold metallo-hydrolase [Pseudonocardiaceae bacterium YIM PH 21723]
MRVHHLNCSTLRPFGRRLINGDGGWLEPATLVCHVLLINTDDGLVLVDSGIGLDDIARPGKSLGRRFLTMLRPALDPAETAARQVEKLGFARSDVRHIVLTHLDVDHAGGLRDFPNATVHVSATELAAARGSTLPRYNRAQWGHDVRWQPFTADGEPWMGFPTARELPGGLAAIPLPGHTRGSSGVVVPRENGWLVHAGDAFFHRGQLDPTADRMPHGLRLVEQAAQTDRENRVANLHRLAELASRSGVQVICAHDPVQLAELR